MKQLTKPNSLKVLLSPKIAETKNVILIKATVFSGILQNVSTCIFHMSLYMLFTGN